MQRLFQLVCLRKARLSPRSVPSRTRPNLEELESRQQPSVLGLSIGGINGFVAPISTSHSLPSPALVAAPGSASFAIDRNAELSNSSPKSTPATASGTQTTPAAQATADNAVEVSNILGNLFIQDFEQGTIGTGGTLPFGPTAGPSGAVGAGGTSGQGAISLSDQTLGLQLGVSSLPAPPLNSTPVAPPPFVPPPTEQILATPVTHLPTGGGGGVTEEGTIEAEPEMPTGDGDTPRSQPNSPQDQPIRPRNQSPEEEGPGLVEDLSAGPEKWEFPEELANNAARLLRGFLPGDGSSSLLETNSSTREESNIDLASALAAVALPFFPLPQRQQEFLKADKDRVLRK